jgi:hydrogenase/urease accessory protein HupE
MAGLVYVLSAGTAFVCAALLWRSYRKNGVRLLFWSGVCFLGLTVENVLLYVDRIKFPRIDLSMPRHIVGLAAFLALVFSLAWDDK